MSAQREKKFGCVLLTPEQASLLRIAGEGARGPSKRLVGPAAKVGGLQVQKSLIEVCTYKYDGTLHRRWRAELLRQDGSLIVLDARFSDEIIHELLGTIASGTHSLEYYWLDRWYNVFRFAHPDGKLRNYYCNVNVPPTFDGETLSYVDLDLDILVDPDLSYHILDVEDFEGNAERYGYSTEIQVNARRALDELVRMIETRMFPFDAV